MPSSKPTPHDPEPETDNQRDDQVEPMHRGAKAEADDYSGGHSQKDSERGAPGTESDAPSAPGGTTGEHSGQKTTGNPRTPSKHPDDDDEAPETPTDEPMPEPIVDPPADDRPRAPMVTGPGDSAGRQPTA